MLWLEAKRARMLAQKHGGFLKLHQPCLLLMASLLEDAAAITFVLFATLVPVVQNLLKTTTLSGQEWLLVLIATVMGTSGSKL